MRNQEQTQNPQTELTDIENGLVVVRRGWGGKKQEIIFLNTFLYKRNSGSSKPGHRDRIINASISTDFHRNTMLIDACKSLGYVWQVVSDAE